jgi:DNA-binding response OmpR family regulator
VAARRLLPKMAMSILFLENHAVFARTVVDEFLSDHEVVIVPSLEEGCLAARGAHFDVLLVDYDLDDAKADAFVRWVRGSGDRTPIIAVSARAEGNDALIRAGANAICPKGEFFADRVGARQPGRPGW